MLPNPQTREEIPVFPQEYQLTTNGDQFLVFHSGIGDLERIFIFTSDLGLQFLYECDQWYADVTFKVCPEVFYQVYTVHGQQRGRICPRVFGLLPNKTEATYTRRNAPRPPPPFALDLWNMFNRTDDEFPRTNNSVEVWHRSFHSHVSSCQPVFWNFLNILRNDLFDSCFHNTTSCRPFTTTTKATLPGL